MGTPTLSWSDMVAVAVASPPGSAIQRAVDPDWWLTPEVMLLREIEHNQRISDWRQSEDAQKKRMHTFPKAIPLSEIERRKFELETDRFQFDSIPLNEARKRLGWMN